jgi:hypothetical protein
MSPFEFQHYDLILLPLASKPLKGMQRLPVVVGQIVDVVAIKDGPWLIRSIEAKERDQMMGGTCRFHSPLFSVLIIM